MTATPGKRTARRRLNRSRYGALLADVQPALPRTVQENERLLATVRRLIDKGQSRTPEESALAEVLIALIAGFEKNYYSPERSRPNEMLQLLLEQHNLRQRDLLDIFPTRSRVSEVMSGKRAITPEQAVALAERFGVDPATFVELPSAGTASGR